MTLLLSGRDVDHVTITRRSEADYRDDPFSPRQLLSFRVKNVEIVFRRYTRFFITDEAMGLDKVAAIVHEIELRPSGPIVYAVLTP